VPHEHTEVFGNIWAAIQTAAGSDLTDAKARSLTFSIDRDNQISDFWASVWVPSAPSGGKAYNLWWQRGASAPEVTAAYDTDDASGWTAFAVADAIDQLDALGVEALKTVAGDYTHVEVALRHDNWLALGLEQSRSDLIFAHDVLKKVSADFPREASGTLVTVNSTVVGDPARESAVSDRQTIVLADLGAVVRDLALPETAAQPGEQIEAMAHADVDGDSSPEVLYLISRRGEDGIMQEPPRLEVAKHDTRKAFNVGIDAGFLSYGLEVADFTGDGHPEILITESAGGSFSMTWLFIYQIQNGQLTAIFATNQEYQSLKASTTLRDGRFTLSIAGGPAWTVKPSFDITGLPEGDEDPAWADPFSGYDYSGLDYAAAAGAHEIIGHQTVSYYARAAMMGDLRSTFRWNGERFELASREFYPTSNWWDSPYAPAN
jgi:hypothetical protein